MEEQLSLWIGFNGLVLGLLALDLGVFHRRAHEVSLKEGAIWSAVWIALALFFNLGLFLWRGNEPGLEFLTGYIIEKSLSVDNLFVFVLIFSVFGVPGKYQHRVLFWGILGALFMRGILIALGTTLIASVEWIVYVFGVFLLYSGVRIGMHRERTTVHPERNPVVRVLHKLIPVTKEYHGQQFFVRQHGRLAATPLLVVLLLIESTDLVFALDSIPAVLAVTDDAFIVYTSNVFAILGLRALYFVLKGMIDRFHYLKQALAVILAFTGIKMLSRHVYDIPTWASLVTILAVLVIAIVMSLVWKPRQAPYLSDSR